MKNVPSFRVLPCEEDTEKFFEIIRSGIEKDYLEIPVLYGLKQRMNMKLLHACFFC
jgi:hypothetical protein